MEFLNSLSEKKILQRLSNGEHIGTLLVPDSNQLDARKQWIVAQVQSVGALLLDSGASDAIIKQGTSLLPIGVISSEGHFNRGDIVDCKDPEGKVIARGLVNYSDIEVNKLCKIPSQDMAGILGYSGETELIHRDNLVII